MSKSRIFCVIILLLLCFSGCSEKKDITVFETALTVTSSPSPIVVPTSVPTPVPEPTKITSTILAAGDVIMHDAVIRSGKIHDDTYNYNDIFKEIKPYVDEADFSLINFEGSCMETDKNYTGYPLFNAPPAIISAFADVGFDMVNNGNNHCLDRKLSGLLESRNIIKQQNMQVIGTFQDAYEPRHKIHDLNGIKVGFLSYTYGCNMNENYLSEEERNNHLSLIDKNRIESEIKVLSPLVDLVVVLMHWGVEYRLEPTEEQKDLANTIFQSGADIILGSHPHVIEPSEIREIDGEIKYVIYSMGNFLSNQIGGDNPNARNNDLTQESLMVSIEIEKDLNSDKTRILSVNHTPTWVHRYDENDIHKYTIIPIHSLEDEIFESADEKLSEQLTNSYKRTMEKVQDYPSSS